MNLSPKSIPWKTARRALFRYFIYGSLMIAGEVAFYTVVKIGRTVPVSIVNSLFNFKWQVDPCLNLSAIWDTPIKVLYGQASLWMFFVYATIGLFGLEPVYRRMKNRPMILRGLVYMLIILFIECISGWILKWITGYDIWYYADHYHIFRYTSWAIAPMWFIVGLLSENFMNLVMKYSEVKVRLRQVESKS